MIKSVFAKYVTAVMLIFVIGFALILFVITSIVNNSIIDDRAEQMKGILGQAEIFLRREMGECTEDHFREELDAAMTAPDARLPELMGALTVRDPAMTVLIADLSGTVCWQSENSQTESKVGLVLSEKVLETVRQGKPYSGTVPRDSSLYPSGDLLCAGQLTDASGHRCGTVAVICEDLKNDVITGELSKSLVSAALLVLLAILIAVYFISDRVTSPLRGMYVATEQFANGNFDTRVPVPKSGSDEVVQLAQAFNQMAESLEHLEGLRNSFIANVSHDLRTPMTTIIGFAEEIRDGVIPQSEQDHYLEIISGEAKRLSRLVESLLDISRIQAGDRKFAPSPFDICEMGRVILISFEQQIDEKKLEVSFECEADRITVLADHDAIYQIFYNICHNAVKFSKPGGSFRVRIRHDRDHKVLVSVYNEGEGIPKADLPFVFDRFYKSDKSRGLDKSGAGLGLFIAKTIIQAHGEKIWAQSEEGEWCEFFFTLTEAGQQEKGADA